MTKLVIAIAAIAIAAAARLARIVGYTQTWNMESSNVLACPPKWQVMSILSPVSYLLVGLYGEHWTSDISARDALKPQVLLPRIKIPVRTRSYSTNRWRMTFGLGALRIPYKTSSTCHLAHVPTVVLLPHVRHSHWVSHNTFPTAAHLPYEPSRAELSLTRHSTVATTVLHCTVDLYDIVHLVVLVK